MLSIQTGINEPRYVGMRGIRQVAGSAHSCVTARQTWELSPSTVGEAGAKVKRVDYFVPALGKGAEILRGSREENIDKVLELLKAKGGLK